MKKNMGWHEFAFSNQCLVHRHLLFWLLWLTYIAFTIFFTPTIAGPIFYHHQPGLNELGYVGYVQMVLLKSLLLLVIQIGFCYAFIYFLLPRYLLKGKYLYLFAGAFLLCLLTILYSSFLYSYVYPSVNMVFQLRAVEFNNNILWTSMSAGLLGSIKVTLIAVAIISSKRWWIKQQEKETLQREKINAELQLLKAQIHPAFLFGTLNNIITHAEVASPLAPQMLIKLSDLLSYMLYECDDPEVSLGKEISMLENYLALEKTRLGEKLEISIQLTGNTDALIITPLILLPFIDNSLSYCNDQRLEQAWIHLNITIDGNHLSMKIINGLPSAIPWEAGVDEQRLFNAQKRLQLLYAGRHRLKINADRELLITQLNLTLEKATTFAVTAVEPTKATLGNARL